MGGPSRSNSGVTARVDEPKSAAMIPVAPDPALFARNRHRFAREMLADSVAVFLANDLASSNGAARGRFRQNPDLYYLTGVTQPETALVLAPSTDARGYAEVLFIRRPDHRATRFAGPGLSPEAASEVSGIRHVRYLDELDGVLHEFVALAGRIYVNTREDRHAYSEAPGPDLRYAERLRQAYPAHKYHRAQPILRRLGVVKSDEEIALVRGAVAHAARGLRAAAEAVSPGAPEHAAEAAAVAAITVAGAEGLAHPVRVASGARALYPEYDANAGLVADGAAVQLQVGVTHGGYHASVARVFPAAGAFTARQREVYARVDGLLAEAMGCLVPGASLEDCERTLRGSLSAAAREFGVTEPAAATHFPSRVFHHVGRYLRDPHAPGTPLRAGMTVTCEPALYLAAEGIGMQLRSIALVTDEGPEDLTAELPTALAEVEAGAEALA